MPDETIVAEQTAAPVNAGDAGATANSPFNESSWVETLQPAAQTTAAATTTPTTEKVEEKPFDVNLFLKEQLGFDDVESAKTQLEEYRKVKETASEKVAAKSLKDVLGEKEGEIYSYLNKKNQLDKASKLELLKATDAATILKTTLEYEYPDLTPDEIDYKLKHQFAVPKKPAQTEDQTDEDYASVIDDWKAQVTEVEKGMIIEAKLARPKLAKYQSELVMPDIPLSAPEPEGPTPEELAQVQKRKELYNEQVGKGLTGLTGFEIQYKDKEVDIPIKYEVTAEEKAVIKPIMDSLFTDFGYFGKRWSNADGSINGDKMARDLVLLEKGDSVLQKMVNEAGTQRLAQEIKREKNIHLNSANQSTTFTPDNQQTKVDEGARAIFRA